MDVDTRTVAYLGAALALIVGGTIATGLLPSTPLYQFVAGALIVLGFAVGYIGIGAFELPD